jgi:hypothetical protein
LISEQQGCLPGLPEQKEAERKEAERKEAERKEAERK